MKGWKTGTSALLGLLLLGAGGKAGGAEPDEVQRLVVGTFDSRALVVAMVHSSDWSAYLNEQRADLEHMLERARGRGDRDLVADLEAIGPAMQQRVHEQGFGTAPIDDLVARIADDLPGVADATGVDLIVSRWDVAWQRKGTRVVDVTDQLVALFDPSERTLRAIREVREHDPVPLAELKGLEDH